MPVTSGGKVVPSALPELAIEKLLAGEIESAWRQHLVGIQSSKTATGGGRSEGEQSCPSKPKEENS